MEDFIPLIILIAISIIGMLGKKKQRKHAERQSPVESVHEEDDLFSWFDKLNDDSPDNQSQMQVETAGTLENIPEQKEQESQGNYNSKSVKDKINSQYAAFSGAISQDEHEDIVDKKQRSIIEKHEYEREKKKRRQKLVSPLISKPKFNLKQAVIYSEIINRKYD